MASPTDRALPMADRSTPADDWPAQATDAIVNVVDQVRDKTTGPILTASRALVFGLITIVLASIVVVLVIVALLRLLNELLPAVWLTYLIVGAFFTGVGAILFRKRHAPPYL
jgi:hypothetical protein